MQPLVEVALADRGDLVRHGVLAGEHAVEVDDLQVGLHGGEQLFPPPHMLMAVVLVVDDPHIVDAGS